MTEEDSPAPGSGRAPVAAGRPPAGRVAAGIACIAASAVAFGSLPIFARLAYASGVDTPTLLLLRFSIAAAILWVVLALRGHAIPRGKPLLVLAGMGAIGYAGQAFSYFTAVRLGSAGLAALLLYLFPAIVAILSRVVLRHHLSPVQVVAIGIALVGSLLTIGGATDGSPLAAFFGVLAAVIYSCYILVGGALPASLRPTSSTAVIATAAALVYAGVVFAGGPQLPRTGAGWAAVLAIAVLCTVVAVALFLAGLERLGPVRASVYSTIEPATTLVLAAILFGEPITWTRAAGGVLVLGAVVLLARGEARP